MSIDLTKPIRLKSNLSEATVLSITAPGSQPILISFHMGPTVFSSLYSIAGVEAFFENVPPPTLYGDAPHDFMDYVVKNYPPGTIISNPEWHAPKLWRAAARAALALQRVTPVAVWVNIYKSDYHVAYGHSSRESADRLALPDRLACVEVEWTEGQGIRT